MFSDGNALGVTVVQEANRYSSAAGRWRKQDYSDMTHATTVPRDQEGHQQNTLPWRTAASWDCRVRSFAPCPHCSHGTAQHESDELSETGVRYLESEEMEWRPRCHRRRRRIVVAADSPHV